jgi:hypothetical protein
MRLAITGPDATQALAELVSHAQYEKLDVTITIEHEDGPSYGPSYSVERQIRRAKILDHIRATYPSLKGAQ